MLGLKADVTRAADVEAAVGALSARWKPLELLVKSYGGFSTVRLTGEIPDGEWDTALRVNLPSVFLSTKAVLPSTKERGWGRIVNVLSIGGRGAAAPLLPRCGGQGGHPRRHAARRA